MIQREILGVDHIALQVPSLEEGLHFFHDILGFKLGLKVQVEGHQIVMIKAGKIEIEMWEGELGQTESKQASDHGVHHLAIQVKDLEAVMAHMKAIDVEVLTDILEPTQGIQEAMVSGPGGIRVQFVEQNIPLLIWRTLKGDFKEN